MTRYRVVSNTAEKKDRDELPHGIRGVLQGTLKKFGLDEGFARYQFVLHWKEIVGEEIAKRTRPECLRNGTLVVRVSNSTWAQELTFQKDPILNRLKRYLKDSEVISDVYFYVGEIK